jgi:hypothetical protein
MQVVGCAGNPALARDGHEGLDFLDIHFISLTDDIKKYYALELCWALIHSLFTGRARPTRQEKGEMERIDTLREDAARFREMHLGGEMVVLPNAWDHASAALMVEAGYPVIAPRPAPGSRLHEAFRTASG